MIQRYSSTLENLVYTFWCGVYIVSLQYGRFKTHCFLIVQVYVVVGIAAVAFTGFLLMLVILKFGGNSKFGIKGKTLDLYLHW